MQQLNHTTSINRRFARWAAVFLLATLGWSCGSPRALAEVILLTNRSPTAIPITVDKQGGGTYEMKVYPQDIVPLIVKGPVKLVFDTGRGRKTYQLKPNTIYFFGQVQGGPNMLDMQELGLTMPGRGRFGKASRDKEVVNGISVDRTKDVGTITVKIMVDHAEAGLQDVWEKRLRARMEKASKILKHTCRLRLKVVDVGRWKSDDAADFEAALKEFEREAIPQNIDLVIGFTSRYVSKSGNVRLGGTYGLLRRHILIREHQKKMTEPERLEVLLHEIGHTLGAVHSPEEVSIMRPKLADNQANSVGFRIAFDPVNAMAMNLVSEAWRFDEARNIKQFGSQTRFGLMNVYALMSRAMPRDRSSAGYLREIRNTYRKNGPRPPRLITDLPPP